MLIFHGSDDRVVPPLGIEKFAKRMQRKKNICQLEMFQGKGHSFFNFNVSARHFEITLNSMDAFLVSLDCIEPVEYV